MERKQNKLPYDERTWTCKKCQSFQGNAGMEEEKFISCVVCGNVKEFEK